MNIDEYKYSFINDAISTISGIKIVEDYESIFDNNPCVHIAIGDTNRINRLAEGRVINAHGSFEMVILIRYSSKRKTNFTNELRKNLGDLKARILNKIEHLSYPLMYKYTDNAIDNYQIVVYGLTDNSEMNGIIENESRTQLILNFDYELTYL